MRVAAKMVKVVRRRLVNIDAQPTKLRRISSACTVTNIMALKLPPSCTCDRSMTKEPSRRLSARKESEFTKSFSASNRVEPQSQPWV